MRHAPVLPLLALVVGLFVGVSPTPLSGQDAIASSGERGWVGISYDLQTAQEGRVRVVVTEVGPGSPAQQAGIVVGDHLVSINGHPARSNFDNMPLQIRPGDSVQVVVSRQGRAHAVNIVAARRPVDISLESSVTFTLTADSMAESMYRAMDSLRVTLVSTTGDTLRAIGRANGTRHGVQIRIDTTDEEAPGWRPGQTATTMAGDLARAREATLEEVRAPFGFWVFRTEAHDSLRDAMEEFNREFRALRVREADRLRPYTDAAGRLNLTAAEAELGELTDVLKSYANRSMMLRRAMDRAAQEAARPRAGYVVTVVEPDATRDEVTESRGELFGPLTPYALGQNRVAGAELVDLQPELAAYFEVDGGVLVVDVLPGTPMARGGVEAGDVITHLDRVTIRSFQELRLALARADADIPLSVVRKGDPLQLLLHR